MLSTSNLSENFSGLVLIFHTLASGPSLGGFGAWDKSAPAGLGALLCIGGWAGSILVLGYLLLLAVAGTYRGAIVGHSAMAAHGSDQGGGLTAPKHGR